MADERPAFVPSGLLQYQIFCLLGLSLVFLALFMQGLLLGNLLILCVGLLAMVSARSWGPFLYLLFLGCGEAYESRFIEHHVAFLDPIDVVLAGGTLTFLVGLTRLNSLVKHIGPYDPRLRLKPASTSADTELPPLIPQKRADITVRPEEIALAVLSVPVWVVLAQAAWQFLDQPWDVLGYHERFVQILLISWTLVIAILVLATLMQLWRRAQMDEETAQVFLQETIWRYTRRDQHRMLGSLLPWWFRKLFGWPFRWK